MQKNKREIHLQEEPISWEEKLDGSWGEITLLTTNYFLEWCETLFHLWIWKLNFPPLCLPWSMLIVFDLPLLDDLVSQPHNCRQVTHTPEWSLQTLRTVFFSFTANALQVHAEPEYPGAAIFRFSMVRPQIASQHGTCHLWIEVSLQHFCLKKSHSLTIAQNKK